MSPEAGTEAQLVEGMEFGPFDEQPEVIQVSAEEPLEGEADLADFFGEATDDSTSEPADDPFDVGATDEQPAPATDTVQDESSESDKAEPEDDDPFGDF
jgi:hypothetical protein